MRMIKCWSHRVKERLLNYYGESIYFRTYGNRSQPMLVFSTVPPGKVVEAFKIGLVSDYGKKENMEDMII